MSTGSKTIADLPEVQILDDKDQFLFFQNSTKKTKRITKGNMANSGGGLRGKFIDAATGNDVGLSASLALTNANLAVISADGAQDSADGKNRVFYQTAAPASSVFTTARGCNTAGLLTAKHAFQNHDDIVHIKSFPVR